MCVKGIYYCFEMNEWMLLQNYKVMTRREINSALATSSTFRRYNKIKLHLQLCAFAQPREVFLLLISFPKCVPEAQQHNTANS